MGQLYLYSTEGEKTACLRVNFADKYVEALIDQGKTELSDQQMAMFKNINKYEGEERGCTQSTTEKGTENGKIVQYGQEIYVCSEKPLSPLTINAARVHVAKLSKPLKPTPERKDTGPTLGNPHANKLADNTNLYKQQGYIEL